MKRKKFQDDGVSVLSDLNHPVPHLLMDSIESYRSKKAPSNQAEAYGKSSQALRKLNATTKKLAMANQDMASKMRIEEYPLHRNKRSMLYIAQ